LLPRIAEEGPHSTTVAVAEIQAQLEDRTALAPEFIAGSLAMLQQHWDALGLLDPDHLRQGAWRFSSFPASLLARSLLETLSQPRPQLVETGWWQNDNYQEQQREALTKLERSRLHFAGTHSPEPIRWVQVAWALIKLDGRLLLNHREDQKRRDHPNYVLIGGRLNLHDLSAAFPTATMPERLEWQQRPAEHLDKLTTALPHTLAREMYEELTLESTHYTWEPLRRLPPFCKLEGARANHAVTRYDITAFSIQLHSAGFQQLCRTLAQQPEGQLLWATPAEIAQGSQADRRLFVDAWRDAAQDDFQRQLEEIPASFTDDCRYAEKVDLPLDAETPLRRGKTGQEQDVDVELQERDVQLLLGLGWHRLHGARYPLQAPPGLRLHPLGWVELLDETSPLHHELSTLAAQLQEAQLPIVEGADLGWFRLSVNLGALYFSEPFFTLQAVHADSDRYELHLHVARQETPLGVIPQTTLKLRKLSAQVFRDARRVLKHQPPEELSDPKKSFRGQLSQQARSLGLRIVFREDSADFYTNCTVKD
jgi:hypothetical protein